MFFKSPNLQKKIIPKNYPGLEIQISRQFQYTVIGGKSKFQVQDSFLEYLFLEIWRFEKQIALSERKPSLPAYQNLIFSYSSNAGLKGFFVLYCLILQQAGNVLFSTYFVVKEGDDLFPLFDICSVEGVAEAGFGGAEGRTPLQILAE